MQKVAALYDIHGNLPALEAVLGELETIQTDAIVIGGDVVAGPMPRQTLDRLARLGDRVRCIRGNADREIVAAFDGEPFALDAPEEVREQIRWAAAQLTRADRARLDAFPEKVTLDINGLGRVLFCHATPRDDEEIFTAISPDARLQVVFAGVREQVVVCGHTHSQFERRLGDDLLILNAGSVGRPYADQPGAYWLLLSDGGPEFRRTAYDLAAAARAIEESGYPNAKEFAASTVLSVMPATETTPLFERMSEERWSRESC